MQGLALFLVQPPLDDQMPSKKTGRPTSYRAEYCVTVIKLGATGASKAEMAHALGCSRTTMDVWAAQHQEFLNAIKEALDLAQGWWEREGRKAVFGAKPGFNATAYIFNMKNRFPADWKDRQAVEHTGRDGESIRAEVTHVLDKASADLIAGLVK